MMTWLTSTYVGKWTATILISMAPVIEIRGGVPYGVGFGLSYWEALFASFIGNMIPVPFILLFLRRIFSWLKTYEKTAPVIERLEIRAHLKGEKVNKYRNLGLFLLVAVPLPGTGAWTGALVASIFDIRIKKAIPIIGAGVLTAGVIMLLITNGVTKVLGL